MGSACFVVWEWWAIPATHCEILMRSDGDRASAVNAGKVPCLEILVKVLGVRGLATD